VHYGLAAVHSVQQHVRVRTLPPTQLIRGRTPAAAHQRPEHEAHLLVDAVADLLRRINQLVVEQDAPGLQDHCLVLRRAQGDLNAERRVDVEQRLDIAQGALGHRGYLSDVFYAQVEPVGAVGVDSGLGRLLVAQA